jgi:hypothetical protein
MERFNIENLNDMEVRNSVHSKFQTGLQLWKSRRITRTTEQLEGEGAVLERKKFGQIVWIGH